MASNELKEYLRSINEDYVRFAEPLHQGSFTNKAELSAAERSDLEALTVPKGPAGLIIQTAKGTGGAPRVSSSGVRETLEAVAFFVPFLQSLMIQDILQSTLSSAHKRQHEVKFELDSYNYYFKENNATLPSRITCMVTGQRLESKFIVAGHICSESKPAFAAMTYNVADLWDVRNSILWAAPIEAAWHRLQVAVFRDRTTGKLVMRVLTDKLMDKRLLDYDLSSGGGCAYSMKKFADYDSAELKVTDDAMPYRRLFLHQAVCAVSYQSGRGHLREGISVNAEDYKVASDFKKKPDVERWINTVFAQGP